MGLAVRCCCRMRSPLRSTWRRGPIRTSSVNHRQTLRHDELLQPPYAPVASKQHVSMWNASQYSADLSCGMSQGAPASVYPEASCTITHGLLLSPSWRQARGKPIPVPHYKTTDSRSCCTCVQAVEAELAAVHAVTEAGLRRANDAKIAFLQLLELHVRPATGLPSRVSMCPDLASRVKLDPALVLSPHLSQQRAVWGLHQ